MDTVFDKLSLLDKWRPKETERATTDPSAEDLEPQLLEPSAVVTGNTDSVTGTSTAVTETATSVSGTSAAVRVVIAAEKESSTVSETIDFTRSSVALRGSSAVSASGAETSAVMTEYSVAVRGSSAGLSGSDYGHEAFIASLGTLAAGLDDSTVGQEVSDEEIARDERLDFHLGMVLLSLCKLTCSILCQI